MKYPASTIQRQFWLVHQLHPNDSAHHIPCVYRLQGTLTVSALEKSFNDIIAAHEIFRTRFEFEKGELFQIIKPELRIELPVVALYDVAEGAAHERSMNEKISAFIHDEIIPPFNLAEGPLLRGKVLKLTETDFVLIFVMHHIVMDLHTKELLGAELSDYYRCYAAGMAPEKQRPPLQYRMYAEWHREWLGSAACLEMLTFWKNRLQGYSGFLNLPTDRPRPSIQSLKGAGFPFRLPESFTDRLSQFNRQHHVNHFLTLLTAYYVLLNRWSRQQDLIVGVPLTNRRKDEYKEIMGCFMNILPTPIDISDDPSFLELLQRVRLALLEAHRHQETPFETIVNATRPKRNPSHNPLFQVGFTFDHPMPLALAGLQVEPIDAHCQGSQLDLFANLYESGREIRGYIEYCTDLWHERSIADLTECYKTLLTSIAADPTQAISRLAMLPEGHLKQIQAWNNTDMVYDAPHILHHLIEDQAARTPEHIAVTCGEQQLTFKELNRKANRLARFLHGAGVGPDVPVGVFMERSLEMVVALCGILKAGGAYVPFDPEYPPQRTAFMMEDTQVPFMLTQERLVSKLPPSQTRIVLMASDGSMLDPTGPTDEASAENLDVDLNPDHLAYIIFTSGSTGRPKGAMNSHRGICNRILWMQDEYRLTPADHVLQKTPYSFDVSVWEFFWPLIIGAELVMAPPGSHKDSSALINLIERHQITTLHFVPSMLRVFLENPSVHRCTSVKRVMCSGEALSFDLMQKFFHCLPVELHNLYGPTEAAVDVTYWACEKDYEKSIVPIGRPVANTTIHILDPQMQPVPLGVPGELHIGGVQVARGYLNRDELTREKFIPDPFSSDPQAKLYKTGDLARFLPDGNVEYLGRLDHQVKVRGFRIELGEIESTLLMHPAVQNSAVLVKEYEVGDVRLAAYLVPNQEQAYTVSRALTLENEAASHFNPYILPNGLTVSHLNKNETDFMYEEIFDKRLYMKYGIEIPEKACVFDVGANIGVFSVFIGVNYPDAKIYAFEPLPPIYEALKINASLYNAEIKTFQLGISSEIKQETFTYYPNVTIISGSHANLDEEKNVVRSYMKGALTSENIQGEDPDGVSDKVLDELLIERLSYEKFTCGLTTLSHIIKEHRIDHIDLLKIDVEKSEIEALTGIEADDWQKISQIVIEVHGGLGQLEQVTRILRDKGFNYEVEADAAVENEKLHLVFGRRPEYAPCIAASHENKGAVAAPNWYNSAQLIKDVKALLAEKLPDYMIPAIFTLLPVMPLTQSGKVDRKTLPEPMIKREDAAVEYVEPQDETQKILAEMWRDLLKVDQVGIHDNFFDIGGNSLLTAYLISQLQLRFSRDIAVAKLFQHPTISALAAYLKQETKDEPSFDDMKKRASLKKQALQERKRPGGRK